MEPKSNVLREFCGPKKRSSKCHSKPQKIINCAHCTDVGINTNGSSGSSRQSVTDSQPQITRQHYPLPSRPDQRESINKIISNFKEKAIDITTNLSFAEHVINRLSSTVGRTRPAEFKPFESFRVVEWPIQFHEKIHKIIQLIATIEI